ncbi:adenosylcobinamide-GDP ribazoletransferase [Parahaliea mediterranea]|uniref:adenosylcobinamide-GDP ribazoletransferase n=1 Tax=Parahaliea mediterranea TaxID=651086 RepID=UPI0019D4746E|nr:adenosylcobinamide-GDP ribazoletransferase [Parahaliea mediterranea]
MVGARFYATTPGMTMNSGPTSLWQREWQACHCAVTFLTRIPLPASPWQDAALTRSSAYFPLVGLLVGSLGALIYAGATQYWHSDIAALLAMAAMLLLTGGFHEDGLADTADGLGGGWSVDDKLRIMKDSRLGTYGALALVMALLLKFALLSALPPASVPAALILGQVLGRWAALPLIATTAYVRSEGTGKPLVGGVTGPRLLAATGFSLLVLVVLEGTAPGAIALAVVALIALWRWHCQRQIGGITGDTLGAGNQLAELAVYLVLAATPG